ncbi:MAG: glycosyl transferase group 1 [Bacteroidetes bacterium]|nr:MAG: glycosyl transferase group 1 [Bacteroidota bacterium]
MEKRPQIAFLSSHEPHDRRSWSGIVYHSYKALQEHCGDVHALGPFKPKNILNTGRGIAFLSRRLLGRGYDYTHSLRLARAAAEFFEAKLKERKYDLIFAPAASTELTYLETDLPIFRLADSTFARMIGYYPFYDSLLENSKKQGHEIERLSIARSRFLLYTSQWAADSAIKDYGADPERIHIFPIGANIETPPEKEKIFPKKKNDPCRLLFLGVEWERKGGPIAFDTLLELEKQGFDARLTVCGCVPPDHFRHEKMDVIPFLDKNDETQRRRFEELLQQTHFLLLPTRAECFGIVFCEASAYGIPSITTDTGGVGGVVFDGINGYRLPHEAGGKVYAEKIRNIYSDPNTFDALAESSRRLYDEKLNWDAWGMEMKRLIDTL